jgi:hypothetical protein
VQKQKELKSLAKSEYEPTPSDEIMLRFNKLIEGGIFGDGSVAEVVIQKVNRVMSAVVDA